MKNPMKDSPLKHVLLGTILLTCFAFAKDAEATKSFPAALPLEFILEIDGQGIPMATGTPVKLTIAGKEVVARLVQKPDRLFKTPGLSFRIPSQHAYEFDDSSPGMKQWTFDGNDNVVIVTGTDVGIEAGELIKSTVDGIVSKFGRKNSKQEKSELTLGGKKYPSVRLRITLAGQRLQYQIASLASGKFTFLIMVQDSLNDDGSESDEAKSVLQLLDKTLKLGE